jgi:hypothetical protein
MDGAETLAAILANEWPTIYVNQTRTFVCEHHRKPQIWWACLDSNQEPDRYERPALTIELQAPPQAAA